ncbi:MAG: site-specific DNA-methyltransferase [Phycisphaerae bacterium]|nr:site-specific DNA-methyltransferase [Phycisphaerae bacterium]
MGLEADKIYRIDCLEGLAKLEPGSVDLAFADPPFNIGYDYDVYDDKKDSETYLEWSRRWMGGVVRALKPDGTFWLAIGDDYAAELKVEATLKLGLTCRSWVIWYYTFGVNCKTKFSRSHTHLFHFTRDVKAFTFNSAAIRVPSARQLVYADTRANPTGRLPDDTWILRPQDLPEGFGPDEDTWYFPRVCGTFKERAGWHGCQMPEQLLGRIIRACSNEGELVLDPFGGSGTTLAVAKKLGRHFVGFELSKEYVKRIEQRLRETKVGDRLDGAPEPLASAPPTNGKHRTARRAKQAATEAAPKPKPARRSRRRDIEGVGTSLPPVGEDVLLAIREAYLQTHRGMSIDRVIADPAINNDFISACRSAGIGGVPAEWNRRLLGLRKAGKFDGVIKSERTSLSREELDGFLFASEIAWQVLARRHDISLDAILCDPELAGEFDRMAVELAPGREAWEYRWGALHLRKEARQRRAYAEALPASLIGAKIAENGRPLDRLGHVPACPGLYVLSGKRRRIYFGETDDLVARSRRHAETLDSLLRFLEVSETRSSEVVVKVLPLAEEPLRHRLGLHSLLLGRMKVPPPGNASVEKQAYVVG